MLSPVPSALDCNTVDPVASAVAIGLETRGSSPNSDRSTFHAFTKMELPAHPAEVNAMKATYAANDAILTFPESASDSVRMFDMIPAHWARDGPKTATSVTVDAGSYVVFQIGLYAASTAINGLSITYSDMKGASDNIPSTALTCFNLGGVGEDGTPFTKDYSLAKGSVGSLWFSLEAPPTTSGRYEGTITLSASGGASTIVNLSINVNATTTPDPFKGQSDIYSMTRLNWLNSKRGHEDVVPNPFKPIAASAVTAAGFNVTLVNKQFSVGTNGLIHQVRRCYRSMVIVDRHWSRRPSRDWVVSRPLNFLSLDPQWLLICSTSLGKPFPAHLVASL